MAILITGLQGSGKSYKAMYDMYYQQDKYYKIFTNIDGLKSTDKILPLNFKNFTEEIITECYNIIVNQSKEYKDAIEYLQRVYILPLDVSKDNRIMLVVDEAQNYFNKKNQILLWFITQHRHLYIELILITQKHTLLHSDYHLFNIAYNAFPPVKQFSKSSIAYNEYAGLPMNEDNFSRKFSLKKEDRIFDMFISGDKVESPNILKRFIWMLLVAITIIVAGIYYFKNMYASDPKENNITTKHIEKNIQSKPLPITTVIHDDEKLYVFVIFDDRFSVLGLDIHEYMPLKLFAYIKKKYFIQVIDIVQHDIYHTSIYAIANTSLEKLFRHKKRNSLLGKGVDTITSFN